MKRVYLLTRSDVGGVVEIIGAFSTKRKWEKARNKFPPGYTDDEEIVGFDDINKNTEFMFTVMIEDGGINVVRAFNPIGKNDNFHIEFRGAEPRHEVFVVECRARNSMEAEERAKKIIADARGSGEYNEQRKKAEEWLAILGIKVSVGERKRS